VPDGAIYCGSAMRQRRLSGSPFANPFKLRCYTACHANNEASRTDARREAISEPHRAARCRSNTGASTQAALLIVAN
jgi:hypothetical protein